ncbi:MAG: sugar ABC transporter permease [Bacilli bacterium]|nr:sugar ABC transporter permease [Bacilli bacterium]
MQDSLALSDEEYLTRLFAYADECSKTVYESQNHGPKRLPDWAKGLLFCAPWIIGFLVFTLYPLIQTIVFSFSTVNLTTQGFQATFIGFGNYVNIFTSDTDFLLAIKTYLIEMAVYVPLITIFSLMLAMLLNTNIRGRSAFRVIFFFPVIITSGPVMKILIEQGVTAMPGLSNLINFDALMASWPDFLRSAFNILTGEFVMILWFSGIQILVFLTALQKIDKNVYEASAIDGANRWEQFWKVTLPAVNSSIVINVVFTTVMQSIFALNPIILKIQSDMNDTAEGKGYGYSSALAFSYFIVMIVVLLIFVFIFKRHNRRRKGVL